MVPIPSKLPSNMSKRWSNVNSIFIINFITSIYQIITFSCKFCLHEHELPAHDFVYTIVCTTRFATLDNDPISHEKYSYGIKKFNADKKVPVFVKGGRTVTVQNMKETDITTVDMKENSVKIIVALDEEGETSAGSLYIDDGLSINPDNSYVEFKTERTGTELMPSFKFSSTTRSTGKDLREISVSGVEFIGIKCLYTSNVYLADGRSIFPSVVHRSDGYCDLFVDFEAYENFDGYFEAKLGVNDIQLFLGKKPDSEPMTTEDTSTEGYTTSSDFSSNANVHTILNYLTISCLMISILRAI